MFFENLLPDLLPSGKREKKLFQQRKSDKAELKKQNKKRSAFRKVFSFI